MNWDAISTMHAETEEEQNVFFLSPVQGVTLVFLAFFCS
jgi:hypothetical protein